MSDETYELLAAVVLMLKPEPDFGANSDMLGLLQDLNTGTGPSHFG